FAREEKLDSRVVFTGHVSNAEARAVMRRARLLAAPSRHEAFGLVALEAMAEGTCVIAADTSGFTDFMRDGENGLLVAPDSAEELRGAILKLFKDDALRRTLEKKGFETASRYDWKEIARRTMAVYERCTAKK
ncbi:MAG: glycosyltransferase family 4 protein, partial [Clostridia bacterium]|nr:glycosyltransferase family 4 protein [Clostridia bacterium]